MSARLAIITGLFVVLEGAAALLMAVGSVHGPSALVLAAPVYFVVAAAVTWWVARRYARISFLLGTGGLMIAAVPGIILLFDRIDQFQYDRRIAGTRVTPAPLRIAISESSYGNTYHGGHEESTRGSYDVAELYRGVLAEGLSPCT